MTTTVRAPLLLVLVLPLAAAVTMEKQPAARLVNDKHTSRGHGPSVDTPPGDDHTTRVASGNSSYNGTDNTRVSGETTEETSTRLSVVTSACNSGANSGTDNTRVSGETTEETSTHLSVVTSACNSVRAPGSREAPSTTEARIGGATTPRAADWMLCVSDSKLLRCLKRALLHRVEAFAARWSHVQSPYRLLHGLVTVEKIDKPDPKEPLSRVAQGGGETLDAKIVRGLDKIFRDRAVKVSFLPGVSIRVLPDQESPALLQLVLKYEGGILGRKKGSSMGMTPWMLVGPLVSLGFLPFVLANLKMLVMTAVALNNMALSSAVFAAVRGVVFGPRPGGNVVYRNEGYRDEHRPHRPHRRVVLLRS